MKRRFKLHEIILLILPVAGLGLWALNSHLHPSPTGSRLQQEEAIEEAVLRKELQNEQGQLKPQTAYISVNGRDAPPTLAVRLARYNITLKPISETSVVKKGIESVVIENSTGAFSSRFTLEPVVWDSLSSAKISISVFSASLCAGASEYQVTWEGTKWVAGKGEVQWVS